MNWLRSKAAFDRATEEGILVRHEMQWTVNYFRYHAEQWKARKTASKSYGHAVYAARKQAMWLRFATSAVSSFSIVGIHVI